MIQGSLYLPEGFERCGVLARVDMVIPAWHSTGRGVGGRGEGTPQKCKATPTVESDNIWKINGVAVMLKLALREKTACWKVHV